MTAVLGGLGAAFCFAGATLCASFSSRLIGSASAVAWVMLVGLAVAGPLAAASGAPSGFDAEQAGWLAVSGLGNVGGLVLVYQALRLGKVALVAPIASTEGAIAALIAVGRGEHVDAGAAVALAGIAAGIVLTALGRDEPGTTVAANSRAAVVFALGAALAFGASLYATGRVSDEVALSWAILPARLAGTLVLFAPLAVSGRLRLTRAALPFVVAGGLCEVGGFASFALGARHSIAISAVLASQFAAIAAVAGFLFLHERLSRRQTIGAGTIAIGVAVLSALRV